MNEPFSLSLFPVLLVIYIIGIIFFYGKQLYGMVKAANGDRTGYVRKMLYGIPIFAIIAIVLAALILIGSLIELGGIDELIKYYKS